MLFNLTILFSFILFFFHSRRFVIIKPRIENQKFIRFSLVTSPLTRHDFATRIPRCLLLELAIKISAKMEIYFDKHSSRPFFMKKSCFWHRLRHPVSADGIVSPRNLLCLLWRLNDWGYFVLCWSAREPNDTQSMSHNASNWKRCSSAIETKYTLESRRIWIQARSGGVNESFENENPGMLSSGIVIENLEEKISSSYTLQFVICFSVEERF